MSFCYQQSRGGPVSRSCRYGTPSTTSSIILHVESAPLEIVDPLGRSSAQERIVGRDCGFTGILAMVMSRSREELASHAALIRPGMTIVVVFIHPAAWRRELRPEQVDQQELISIWHKERGRPHGNRAQAQSQRPPRRPHFAGPESAPVKLRAETAPPPRPTINSRETP